MKPIQLFDPASSTYTYVLFDQTTRDALIIDPVDEQIERDYEEETGVQITDCFKERSPKEVPMVIVAGHAPFTWGKSGADAVYHAVILEEIARMAYLTKTLQQNTPPLKQGIVDKHYLRKHGKNAYYGQK